MNRAPNINAAFKEWFDPRFPDASQQQREFARMVWNACWNTRSKVNSKLGGYKGPRRPRRYNLKRDNG